MAPFTLLNCTGERDILLLSAYSLLQAGVEYVDEHGEQRMALPKERLEHPDAALWANFRLALPMCRALFDEVPKYLFSTCLWHNLRRFFMYEKHQIIKFKKALHKFWT